MAATKGKRRSTKGKGSTRRKPQGPPLGHGRAKLTDLSPADRNPRKGSIGQIVDSLREFGQHRPVVVQRASGQIIAGNHLYLAAQTLGWDEVDVFYVDDDDEKALRRAIADNAVGDKAAWDKEMLGELLDVTGPVPGFDEREIQKLRESLEVEDEEEPVFPIVARMSEQYDYVVIVATNETDAAWLHTRFDLRREKSYKSQQIGLSRVVDVERAREVIDG